MGLLCLMTVDMASGGRGVEVFGWGGGGGGGRGGGGGIGPDRSNQVALWLVGGTWEIFYWVYLDSLMVMKEVCVWREKILRVW